MDSPPSKLCARLQFVFRSDVFRAMLVNDMREKATKQINLVDIDPDIFKVQDTPKRYQKKPL